ncbi:TPA: nucleoside-diphosphate kinase [Candidatus Woesearchaeota archaeon]|nr:nucleoside-diphosphate kinase [Candidatus Woesearchaeota archaeon]
MTQKTSKDPLIERTLVLVKPDGVERQISGEIITRIERTGLKIVGLKMTWMTKDFAKKHYKAHVTKAFYKSLEDFMISGPVFALCVEGISAIELVRKIVGATEPKSAAAGTIRGDYSHHSYAYADKKGIAIKNLIHASGDKNDAEYEVPLWFNDSELFEYKSVHEKHTL